MVIIGRQHMNNDTFKASITFGATTEGLMYKVRFILAIECLVGGNIYIAG